MPRVNEGVIVREHNARRKYFAILSDGGDQCLTREIILIISHIVLFLLTSSSPLSS